MLNLAHPYAHWRELTRNRPTRRRPTTVVLILHAATFIYKFGHGMGVFLYHVTH